MTFKRINWVILWRWAGMLALVLLMLLPAAPANADVGPKPGMLFKFEYPVQGITLTGGDLLVCEQADCSDEKPLMEAGPQRFRCDGGTCSTVLYGSSPYYRLRLTFSDKPRESAVFKKERYNAEYLVTVRQNDLLVQENTTIFGREDCFCGGLFLTLVLETLIAGLFTSTLGLSRALVGWVPLASLFTLPAVWFGFPLLPVSPLLSTGLAEGFAVLAEAGLIYLATQRTVPFRWVLLLSTVMNALSFIAGWVI
jgi:hypothetical protein